jgi:peptide/nickel transport system permease protein
MTDRLPDDVTPQSPAVVFWTQMKKSPLALAGGAVLGLFYLLALFAPFVAPYPQEQMDRARYFHPPQSLHWVRADGTLSVRPYVRDTHLANVATFEYEEDPQTERPLRFLVQGAPYELFGMLPMTVHLFGVDEPGRVFLLGTDSFGRDLLSRLLFGAQISLTVGLVGIAISFTLGLLLGGIAGYFGGFVDTAIMRFTELLLSIPSLYLIIALRAVFPMDLPSHQVYLGIVAILAFIGWAGLARVIRGLVLSMRRSDFVTAAEALGFGRLRVIVRHVLPNTMSYVIVAATLSIPGYILGEVVLSFWGSGCRSRARRGATC